jgi:hypothetical protein
MFRYFLWGLGAFFALALIGWLCERSRLPKCTKCGKGRLRKKREVTETYQGPGGSYKYGIRSVAEHEKGIETTYCDRCSYKLETDFDESVGEWIGGGGKQ